MQQVVQVPLQFFLGATDTGSAGDQAGAGGHFQLVHDLAQLLAFFAFDAARDAAPTRVVGHQYQVAACQRNEGGQGSALVAAFVLVYLNNQLLADAQCILDARLAGFKVRLEIAARDFLEGQKAVAIGAVVNKGRFEAGLDAGDDGFVDIALALFFGGRLDVDVDQFLTINNRDAEFFGLRRIE